MQDILKQLDQKKKLLDQYRPFPKALRVNLDQWFKVELTYTSNAIEGNTLTRQQTAQIIEKGITVTGKSIQEHLEAVNHAQAFEFISQLASRKPQNITLDHILKIHHTIMHNIDPDNSGRFRTVSVRIAGSVVVLPNPAKVLQLMKQFISWLNHAQGHPVQIAAAAHFKLVSIHPFTDGNGRTARLLMNLILAQSGFPPAIIRKQDRHAYIKAIESGQLHHQLNQYYLLIFRAVSRSLDLYLDALKPKPRPSKSQPQKLLKIGQLAQKSGQSIATIRYWTQQGLLPVVKRTPGGYQLYSLQTLTIIKKIRRLQRQDRLTIKEIKQKLNQSLSMLH